MLSFDFDNHILGMLYFLFYISTLFITIVMLNLLIAIIGEAYDVIKAAE